jgi:hypothetical protein
VSAAFALPLLLGDEERWSHIGAAAGKTVSLRWRRWGYGFWLRADLAGNCERI